MPVMGGAKFHFKGAVGHICGPGIRACRFCGFVADYLCDQPMGGGKTCDAQICEACAVPLTAPPPLATVPDPTLVAQLALERIDGVTAILAQHAPGPRAVDPAVEGLRAAVAKRTKARVKRRTAVLADLHLCPTHYALLTLDTLPAGDDPDHRKD